MRVRRTSLTTLKELSEINLTPLMDLTFILLITFIITFPLIEHGIAVNLPQGKAQELDEVRARTVTLDRQGRVFLDTVPIDLAGLGTELADLAAADAGTTVLVRADRSIRYEHVVRVLRVLQDAKIARIALVTQAEGK